MQRIISLAATCVVLVFAAAPAASQQLQQPTTIPANPATLATPPATISSDPDQRPVASSPIPSVGPARQLPAEPARKRVDPTRPVVPPRVLDDKGIPVTGAIQVTPTRVYDPKTGRYYQTPPTGNPR